MLSFLNRGVRLCDGVSRREVLRVGGLGFTGLLWSDWLQARAAQATPVRAPAASSFGKAKACILIFNYGGPSHIDSFDLKPEAPVEIRGEFQPTATSVAGTSICEHLPRLAAMVDRYTILRSVNHADNDHAVGAYLALTAHPHPRSRPLGIEPAATPQDMPSLGAIVSKLGAADKSMFPYVTLGELRHFGNKDSMGQNAGCLGHVYDPFAVPFTQPMGGDDVRLDMRVVGSMLGDAQSAGGQLTGKRELLDRMNGALPALESMASTRDLDGFRRKAYELLASPASRDAFELAKEPENIRDLYGDAPFARNCLLARRLVEAGVPMVTVYSVANRDWDTHGDNFKSLKNTLLPATDRGLSALLRDLQDRGLLDETLVVWMGDMGRTPLVNKGAGRDHWSFCYSIVMAGGGVRPGQVYGSSDRNAAYPASQPVSPADMAATIYHCLGIDPRSQVADQQGRPLHITLGEPVRGILG
ncbi:MAG TPA: DUF1501 domain-containing protein [Pirellulales bacterium]|jgi:hypothetical protein|nr:DUF1501 domain-containing protein [Pirellulales bacterium]